MDKNNTLEKIQVHQYATGHVQEKNTSAPKTEEGLKMEHQTNQVHPENLTKEIGGPKGLEPTRYGDWEKRGRCIDF